MADVKAALERVRTTIAQLEGAEWGSPGCTDIQRMLIVDEWLELFGHRSGLVASRAGMVFLERVRRLLAQVKPAVQIQPEVIVELVGKMVWQGCPQMAWWAACRLGRTLTQGQLNEAWQDALALAADDPPEILDRLDYWRDAYRVVFGRPAPDWSCPIWRPYLMRDIMVRLLAEQYDQLEAGASAMGTDVVALLARVADYLARNDRIEQPSLLAPAVRLLQRSYESGEEARAAVKDRLAGWWYENLTAWSDGFLHDIHRHRMQDAHRAGDPLAEADEIEARLEELEDEGFVWHLGFNDSPWQPQVAEEVARLKARLLIVQEYGLGVTNDGEPDEAVLDALDILGDEYDE